MNTLPLPLLSLRDGVVGGAVMSLLIVGVAHLVQGSDPLNPFGWAASLILGLEVGLMAGGAGALAAALSAKVKSVWSRALLVGLSGAIATVPLSLFFGLIGYRDEERWRTIVIVTVAAFVALVGMTLSAARSIRISEGRSE